MDEQRQDARRARRGALALAAVLAATVLTGAAAITGLTRHPLSPTAAPAMQQAPLSQRPGPATWAGDD
jgi:hypothetical protein